MTDIRTYRQERPADWLREHPGERWRCDILPGDGSDHHGVGATEAEALMNAALAWRRWEGGCPKCGANREAWLRCAQVICPGGNVFGRPGQT